MDFAEILYGVADHVATITLNRPNRLNAWTFNMQRELKRAFGIAAEDSNVRVIMVTGAGRGFCAGADLENMADAIGAGTTDFASAFPELASDPGQGRDFEQPLSYPLKVAKPVIAAINGPVAGVGLCFSLYCDIRFIAAGAKVSVAFSARGLIAEYGIAWLLPRLVGPMSALDLLYSSRTIAAEEAAAIGLATLLPAEGFHEAVRTYAVNLATAASPRSLAVIKRQVWGAQFSTLAEACVEADREMIGSLYSQDFREGVNSFLQKRPPRFTGN